MTIRFSARVNFDSGAAGVIEASRIAAGRIFGVFWEVSGTEGTLYMDGERFNELQVYRFNDDKHDRGFKTLYAEPDRPMPLLRLRFWRRWAGLF